jgi:hypothetical protein
MRKLSILTLLAASPLLAQSNPADPDRPAAGGGQLPTGWSYRLDRASDSIAHVKFVTMGPGLHFTSGPAGIYWRDADRVTGSFHAIATFNQTKAPEHPEAYGLFVMGKNLKDSTQTYTYFLVRGNGMYSVWQRQGMGRPTALSAGMRGWVTNEAVVSQDATSGQARNTLEISGDAAGRKLTFKVNGKTVHEITTTGSIEGIVGIRMNHNLDVHVDGFAVHKM